MNVRRVLASSAVGASVLLAFVSPARAAAPPDATDTADPTLRPIRPERRNGVVLGATGGFALAGASGYPNHPALQDDPNFYSSSPLLAGYAMSFFVMGALSDAVSFGPTVAIATFESPGWKSTGWGAGFRGEVFPFVRLAPVLADLAAYAHLGFGATELRAKGPYPTADGVQSFFGGGLHHEWRLGTLLGGHAAAGPYLEYDAIRSPSAERHWLTTGLRVVWYGGRVGLDP